MKFLLVSLALVVLMGVHDFSHCLTPEDIVRLRANSVGQNVIEALIEEKAIETCAFTVDEIIRLKKVGFRDEELERIVRKGSFLKGQQVIVIGKETVPIKAASIKDLLELKEAGFSEEVIKTIILISSDSLDNNERKKAWEMLKNMGIILDLRETDGR